MWQAREAGARSLGQLPQGPAGGGADVERDRGAPGEEGQVELVSAAAVTPRPGRGLRRERRALSPAPGRAGRTGAGSGGGRRRCAPPWSPAPPLLPPPPPRPPP